VRAVELACERLQVAKVALLCFSGGTIVGLTMARRRPDLFSAYIGSGQIVDWERQDAAGFELLLARARARGDESMLRELTAIGPPPYIGSDWQSKFMTERRILGKRGGEY